MYFSLYKSSFCIYWITGPSEPKVIVVDHVNAFDFQLNCLCYMISDLVEIEFIDEGDDRI